MKDYQRIFRNEFIRYQDKELVDSSIAENPHVKAILDGEAIVDKQGDIIDLSHELLKFSIVDEKDIVQMNNFFGQLEYLLSHDNANSVEDVIALFTGKNWFL